VAVENPKNCIVALFKETIVSKILLKLKIKPYPIFLRLAVVAFFHGSPELSSHYFLVRIVKLKVLDGLLIREVFLSRISGDNPL
jgi:hypothetical protein